MTPQPDRIRRPLDALNFFLADVRDGLGPYLAIYLLAVQKWDEATIGVALAAGGIAGIIAQAPAGALIDGSRAKRAIVIAAAVAITLASLAIPLAPTFLPVTILQAMSGVAGAIFPPAIAAITLGTVGPKAFSKRIGRNEAFNHGGNAASAALAGILAYAFGPVVVFWLMAAMAALSIFAMLSLPADAIDHEVARGLHTELRETHAGPDTPSGFAVLLTCRPLLIFAASTTLFHFANAAMLPLVGQKLSLIVGKELGTSLMSACIVAAQLVMVPVAMLVGAKADVWGRKPIFTTGLAVLALRGALYTLSDEPAWLVGVQLLDGIGAGIFGALFPLVVADLTRGTGHFNISQGAIATAQGIGASLSNAIAGLIVVKAGYSAAFLALAGVAGTAFLFFTLLMPETRPASPEAGERDAMPAPA